MSSGNTILRQDISYSDGRILWAFSTPINPDTLVQLRGIDVYETMLTDDQVTACLHLRTFPLVASGWGIEEAGDEPQDVRVADFCRSVLDGLPGNFSDVLIDIMDALAFGFSIAEQNYRVLDEGEFRGLVSLKNIKSRHPYGIEFQSDARGNLTTITQNTSIDLPPWKMVHFAYQSKYDNFYGRSILRAAYRHWFSKDINIKFMNIFNERYGMPTAVGKLDTTATAYRAALERILHNLQSKTSITLPPGVTIEFLEAASRANGVTNFLDAIRYFDRGISQATLIPANLGYSPQGNTGSLAQAQIQFKSYVNWLLTPDQVLLEDVVNEQIIKRLVDLNFDVRGRYPKFFLNRLSDTDREKIANAWMTAVTGGAVANELEDENTLRALLGFRPRQEEEQDTAGPTVPDEELEALIEKAKKQTGLSEIIEIPFARLNKAQSTVQNRLDKQKVAKELDALEERYALKVSEALKAQRDILISQVENARKLGTTWVNKLVLEKVPDIRAGFTDMFRESFRAGQKQALGTLPPKFRKKAKTFAARIADVVPEEALKYFEDKAFYITDLQDHQVLDEVKGLLYRHIRDGLSLAETISAIRTAYEKYIYDPALVETLGTPHRLETTIRTNVIDAYNKGSLNTYRQPELVDFIPGMQYSAVLDARTSEYCRFMHGRQLRNTDPEVDRMTPPNHFNCRSMWLPILIGETLNPMNTKDMGKARDLISKRFY